MSDFNYKLYWDELIRQLSSLTTQFGLIPPESDYHIMGQNLHESLHLLLMDAWKGASPLNRISTQENQQKPAKEIPEPETLVKQKKERYKPMAMPYFSEQEDPERMEQLFTQLLFRCCRPDDKNHMYAGGVEFKSSKIMACLYSACACYLKNDQRQNLNAFYKFFDKIRTQMGAACPITVKYDAILGRQQEWKKLADVPNYYERLFIHQISLEEIKNEINKKALITWKQIYGLVVEDARAVGLIPPAVPPQK